MSNRSVYVAVLLGIMGPLLTPQAAWSYDNDGPGGGPHRKINQIALERFLQAAAGDPILKYYDFAPTLVKLGIARPSGAETVHPFVAEYDTVTQKGDWYPEEATAAAELAAHSLAAEKTPSSVTGEGKQARPFPWWIVEGGFTADEPEVHMSLRHFYDPQMRGVSTVSEARTCSYLTDVTDAADRVLSRLVGSALNPCVDAKQLALKESKHSWSEGQSQLKAAFDHPEADARLRNGAFGKAWRCLGETMHLMADMTTPAHVRNDGHPGKLGYAGDPYEAFVSAQVVQDLAGGPVEAELAKSIVSCPGISRLFDLIATHTNIHYFSNDTISGLDYPTTLYRPDLLLRRALDHPKTPVPAGINVPVHNANGQPDYDAPRLDAYSFRFTDEQRDDSGTYVDRLHEGRSIAHRMADGKHVLDENCVYWQAAELIPVAVAANRQVIDLFLPRFGVKVDEFDRKAKVLKCHVVGYTRDLKSGKFTEAATTQFPGDSVRAVVFVTIGKEQHNSLQPLDEITAGRFEVRVQPVVDGVLADYLKEGGTPVPAEGIGLAVGLDMGGVLIKSEPKLLGSVRVEPRQVQLKAKAGQQFTVRIAGMKDPAVQWKVNENGGGTIDQKGAYVAPVIAGTFHVVATSKADNDASDVATVRVEEAEKKEVPPPPPLADDISWQQAAYAAAGCRMVANRGASYDKIYQVGDTRHGFVFQGDDYVRVPGKPVWIGWCKEFSHGTLGTGPSAKPYWLYYTAEVEVSLSSVGTSDGLRPDGVWDCARRDSDWGLKGDPAFKPVALGDVAIAKSNGPRNWQCRVWRGPFRFDLSLVGQATGVTWDDFNGKPEEGQRNALIAALPQAGLEYGKAILDSFDPWCGRPLAGGPGPKGLYWPLHVGKYRFRLEEVPAGLTLVATQSKDQEWGYFGSQDLKVQNQDQTKPPYNPGTCYVSMQAWYPEQGDTKVQAPLLRAKEAMNEKLADFRKGWMSADRQALDPVRLALPGADEAVEILIGYKPSDAPNWRPGPHGHLVIARRANVLVLVRHEYTPEKTMTPSPWPQKLAELTLARTAADKPVPAAK